MAGKAQGVIGKGGYSRSFCFPKAAKEICQGCYDEIAAGSIFLVNLELLMPLLETDNEKLKVGQFRQKQAFKEKEDWSAFRGGLLKNSRNIQFFLKTSVLFPQLAISIGIIFRQISSENVLLKVPKHETFNGGFFHLKDTSGPLIHNLKLF
jgi:hypothetical protein